MGGASRAARKIQDAEFAGLVTESPDFVFATDRDHRLLYANRQYAAFVGVSPELLVGRLDTEFFQPREGALPGGRSFRALDEEALSGVTVPNCRVSALHDGELLHYDVFKLPLRDADGEVYGVLTHARDVTASVHTEEALRASEARYRDLLEHAPVGVYVHDGTNVLFGNRAFAALMGAKEPEELVGYPVIEIAHPEERARLRERIRAIEDGLVATPAVDFRAVRLDGGIRHVRVMATKCTYEDRPAVQVVIIDETERLAAEGERDALEAQLLHAQRLDALGTLAGGVAHDFNNLLAVIVANAELAKMALPPAHKAGAPLEEVLVATTHASELVRSILAFSRRQPLERKPILLADSIREVARLIRAMLPRSISLVVEPCTSDSRAIGDPTQVHQALMNLCTNAWHAIGEDKTGEIRISSDAVLLDDAGARAHPDLRAGRYVRLSVRDNGSGMDEATLACAFDPFFTTKGVGAGTGLGLSVVHGIVKGHGGAVIVSSEQNVGTEVRLYFPAATAPLETVPQDAAQPAPSRSEVRVMVVDDEVAMRSVVLRTLKHLGFHGVAHATAIEALTALRAEPTACDLLVTDYAMPGGSGLDLARQVRTLRPDLPVVLISGYLDDAVRAAAVGLGIRVLLAKPFTIEQLTAALHTALQAGQRSVSAGP